MLENLAQVKSGDAVVAVNGKRGSWFLSIPGTKESPGINRSHYGCHTVLSSLHHVDVRCGPTPRTSLKGNVSLDCFTCNQVD